jgi:hypothetical protein
MAGITYELDIKHLSENKTQTILGLRVIVWVKKQHKSHKVAVDIEE